MKNIYKTKELIRLLKGLGVNELVVCAGARNAPLVVAAECAPYFRTSSFFEERDAAFFALGRIKALRSPVAVITTSGTAAAELLPATIEAYYAGLPSVLVTADRPLRFRGTGAPQAIEQAQLFGPYAETFVDWVEMNDLPPSFSWSRRGPLHLNVSLEEPTNAELAELKNMNWPEVKELDFSRQEDESLNLEAWTRFQDKVKRPLVVAGPMSMEDAQWAQPWVIQNEPVLVSESLANLSADEGLRHCRMMSPDRTIPELLARKEVDGVIRLGGIPTIRFWRDLEIQFVDLPVIHASGRPFLGLARPSYGVVPLSSLSDQRFDRPDCERILSQDRRIHEDRIRLFHRYPSAELSLLRGLTEIIPEDARIFLGNSLPIREWDQVLSQPKKGWTFEGHRGANGIDGQISGFLGFAVEGLANWGIFGDLTALYNLAAPWALTRIRGQAFDLNIVIINNGGGRIFARLHDERTLQNEHRLNFSAFADLWDLEYVQVRNRSDWGAVLPRASRPRVIEVRTNEEESRSLHEEWGLIRK